MEFPNEETVRKLLSVAVELSPTAYDQQRAGEILQQEYLLGNYAEQVTYLVAFLSNGVLAGNWPSKARDEALKATQR